MSLSGACHCGAVHWQLHRFETRRATVCNCSFCRRVGAIWAYGDAGDSITTSGETRAYTHGDGGIGFHACPRCNCLTFWRATAPNAEGVIRIAVNLRMADPAAVADLPVYRFDGSRTWQAHHEGDPRRVGDYLD